MAMTSTVTAILRLGNTVSVLNATTEYLEKVYQNFSKDPSLTSSSSSCYCCCCCYCFDGRPHGSKPVHQLGRSSSGIFQAHMDFLDSFKFTGERKHMKKKHLANHSKPALSNDVLMIFQVNDHLNMWVCPKNYGENWENTQKSHGDPWCVLVCHHSPKCQFWA